MILNSNKPVKLEPHGSRILKSAALSRHGCVFSDGNVVLYSDMDVSRNSATQGVMSTIPAASPIIVTSQDATRDEESGCTVPSTPGAGSLQSVASITTVICNDKSVIKQEKWWSTTLQVAVPFFLAGVGTIGAGLTLGIVQVSSPLSVSYLTTDLLFPSPDA